MPQGSLLLLEFLRKRLQYTGIKLGSVWPGKGDLLDQKIRKDVDELAIASLVQLWLVHEFSFIQILIRVLVGDGKLEMQS